MTKYLKRIDYHLIMAIIIMLLIMGYILLIQGCALSKEVRKIPLAIAKEHTANVKANVKLAKELLKTWHSTSTIIELTMGDRLPIGTQNMIAQLNIMTHSIKNDERYPDYMYIWALGLMVQIAIDLAEEAIPGLARYLVLL